MPAPYSLITIPPGDHRDVFESQAITMSLVHNMFIRGINAIIAQAPAIEENQVQSFMFFCSTFMDSLRHHHTNEEELYFPELEKQLGEGTMTDNVDQHHSFLPQLAEFELHLQGITKGEEKYDGAALVQKIYGFSDFLVEHLYDEIKSLESSRLRKGFTAKELTNLEKIVLKRVLDETTFTGTLPLNLTLHDQNTAPWFPPFPKPILWATQYIFFRKHSDAWTFAPCDVFGRLKDNISHS